MARKETTTGGIVFPAGFSPESAIDSILHLETILDANQDNLQLMTIKQELSTLFKMIDSAL